MAKKARELYNNKDLFILTEYKTFVREIGHFICLIQGHNGKSIS